MEYREKVKESSRFFDAMDQSDFLKKYSAVKDFDVSFNKRVEKMINLLDFRDNNLSSLLHNHFNELGIGDEYELLIFFHAWAGDPGAEEINKTVVPAYLSFDNLNGKIYVITAWVVKNDSVELYYNLDMNLKTFLTIEKYLGLEPSQSTDEITKQGKVSEEFNLSLSRTLKALLFGELQASAKGVSSSEIGITFSKFESVYSSNDLKHNMENAESIIGNLEIGLRTDVSSNSFLDFSTKRNAWLNLTGAISVEDFLRQTKSLL